ncbi:MAG: Chromate transporter [Synergistetes bacterium ADurb.Bin520]|nr:MAG: Chromate transporter [Synergistetes bacterium ADurb.Bin520]
MYALARQWDRAKDAPWRGAVERGLAPVAIGLIFAGGWALGREILDNPWEYAILALSTFVLARWNVNPLKLMVAVGTLALGAGILLGG